MKETWLTTRETAAALKISCRAVKKNAAGGRYVTKIEKTPNGQTGYLIALSSLPAAAAGKAPEAKPAEEPGEMTGCSEKQKAEAFRRLEILQQWEIFARRTGRKETAAAADYLQWSQDAGCSRTTLFRWRRDYREHGIVGLIPDWRNGKAGFADEIFCQEAKRRAQQHYLQLSRISYKQVFKAVKNEGILKGWEVPSYDTCRRYLRAIPAPARILLREGRKACDDKALPAILRSMDGLRAMEIIESDHHQMDVAVIDAEGSVFFPWLTIWFDVRARRPLGWILSTTPNSDGIRIAFMRTLVEFGVPLAVHIDNGKDYRAKVFRGEQGRFRLEKTELKNDLKPSLIEGIYGSLGIKVHWAIPYNAKTKVIERFFRSLRTEFSVWFRGYRGKNTLEKPETLARQMRKGDVYPFDGFKLAVQKWIDVEYCQNREHQGLGLATPDQVFAETRIEKRTVRDEEMLWLCSEYPRRLKVGRNGIYFMNDYYWSEKIACDHLGEHVLLRYNDNDLSRVFVTDEAGRFIGMADKRNPGTWNMGAEEYRKHLRMKKAVRESAMPYAAIAKELPAEERERLYLQLIGNGAKPLPPAPERQVETPFAAILEEDRRRGEERREIGRKAADYEREFAAARVEPAENERARIERGIEEFLKSYRRNA